MGRPRKVQATTPLSSRNHLQSRDISCCTLSTAAGKSVQDVAKALERKPVKGVVNKTTPAALAWAEGVFKKTTLAALALAQRVAKKTTLAALALAQGDAKASRRKPSKRVAAKTPMAALALAFQALEHAKTDGSAREREKAELVVAKAKEDALSVVKARLCAAATVSCTAHAALRLLEAKGDQLERTKLKVLDAEWGVTKAEWAYSKAELDVAKAQGNPTMIALAEVHVARKFSWAATSELRMVQAKGDLVEISNANLRMLEAELGAQVAEWSRVKADLDHAKTHMDTSGIADKESSVALACLSAARAELALVSAQGDQVKIRKVKLTVKDAELSVKRANWAKAKADLDVAKNYGDPLGIARADLLVAETGWCVAEAEFDKVGAKGGIVKTMRDLNIRNAQSHGDGAALAEARTKLNIAEAAGDPKQIAEAELYVAEICLCSAHAELRAAKAKRVRAKISKAQLRVLEAKWEVDKTTWAVAKANLDIVKAQGNVYSIASAELSVARNCSDALASEIDVIQAKGDKVELARAKLRKLETDWDVHKAHCAVEKAMVGMEKAGGNPLSIARSETSAALWQLWAAQSELKVVMAKGDGAHISQAELRVLDAELGVKVAEWNQAKAELVVAQAGKDPLEIALAELRIVKISSCVTEAEVRIAMAKSN